MSFNLSSKREDVSLKLKAQNFSNIKEQTKRLEVDNQKMEEQLQELKMAMGRERAEREQSQVQNFWQSGQVGSLSTYGKEVLTKPKKTEPNKQSQNAVHRKVKVLKDELIVVPERPKGPGTMAFIAQKTTAPVVNSNNKKDGRRRCGQCEEKTAHVSCIECCEDYCAACFAAFHLRGALKKHRSVPVGAETIRTPRNAYLSRQEAAGDGSKENIHHKAPLADAKNVYNVSKMQQHTKRPDSPGSSENSHFLDGTYNEAESAASFQEALRAWRQEPPATQKPASHHRSIHCTELGTSTDDSTVDRTADAVAIKFTPSLTYAEKLLLKKHRRMELPPVPDTSRSCESVLESSRVPDVNPMKDRSLSASDRANSRLKTTDEDGADYDGDYPDVQIRTHDWAFTSRPNSELRRLDPNNFDDGDTDRRAVPGSNAGRYSSASLRGPSASSDGDFTDDLKLNREESCVSIIEIDELAPNDRLLDRTTCYSVTEVADETDRASVSSNGSTGQRAPRSAFTRSAAIKPSTSPRPPPPRPLQPGEAFQTPVENFRRSRIRTNDGAVLKTSIENISSSKSARMSTTKPTDRVAGTVKSETDIGDKKRATLSKSRETMNPSTEKKEISAVGKSTVLSSRGKAKNFEDLEKKPELAAISIPSELTPRVKSSATKRQKDGRGSAAGSRAPSRTGSRLSIYGEGQLTKTPSNALHFLASTTLLDDAKLASAAGVDLGSYFTLGVKPIHVNVDASRPASARVSATPRPISSRPRVSNQLYQLGPRSWKPDTSLGQNVSVAQAQPIVQETNQLSNVLSAADDDADDLEKAPGSVPLLVGNSQASTDKLPNHGQNQPRTMTNKNSQLVGKEPNVNDQSQRPRQVQELVNGSSQRSSQRKSAHDARKSQDVRKLQSVHGELQSSVSHSSQKVSDKPDSRLPAEASVSRDSSRITFSLSHGVTMSNETQRSFSDMPERSVTPNMMVPRRSYTVRPVSARSSCSRPETPATSRTLTAVVVDGEDLSRFDDNNLTAEQTENDENTLQQLERELSSESLSGDTEKKKFTKDDSRTTNNNRNQQQQQQQPQQQQQQQQQQPPQLVSDDFDVTSALRESTLMYDFEEMEAEIMQQMEVKALP